MCFFRVHLTKYSAMVETALHIKALGSRRTSESEYFIDPQGGCAFRIEIE